MTVKLEQGKASLGECRVEGCNEPIHSYRDDPLRKVRVFVCKAGHAYKVDHKTLFIERYN